MPNIERLLAFIRSHGNKCGYGNGRIAIATEYTRYRDIPTNDICGYRTVITNDTMTELVRPTWAAVRTALGY